VVEEAEAVAAAAAEPVPADEVPAVVAAEADEEPLPATREERAEEQAQSDEN
jgi:hypothetical protein